MATYAFPLELVAPGTGLYHRKGEASMLALADGRCLLAYGRYRSRRQGGATPIEGDNDKAAIAAVPLDERGRLAGEERVLVPEPEDGLNVMAPALRRLADGRIGMLYSLRLSTTAARRMFTASADEGLTWSEPVAVAGPLADGGEAPAYQTGCHDRFNVLADGTLLAPLHCTDDWDAHYMHVRVARSTDGGASWTLGPAVRLPQVGGVVGGGAAVGGASGAGAFTESGCVEPGVVERADGSLLMVLRTAMGTLFASESHDGGVSWSGPRSMEVVSPQAPAHISRVPGSSDLLLVWTADYDAAAPLGGRRHTVMACVSKDGGRSWPHERRKTLVYDPGRHIDYPAVLYSGHEVWITLRAASGPNILDGLIGTGLMRVPLGWLY